MNFDKVTNNLNLIFLLLLVVGGGEGGGGAEIITICQKQNVICGKIQKNNHLHTVEHMVQSTFQNMLITFQTQTVQLLF